MFSIGIRYLNGWAMAAADGARKERAEWPPHPDRVFMALAAAWFETGQEAAEGAALRWLEALPTQPSLAAPEATFRCVSGEPRPPIHYVPVNDTAVSRGNTVDQVVAKPAPELAALKDVGLGQLVEFRLRQPRSFPVAIPHADNEAVHLVWQDSIPNEHRAALASLCYKVVSVGHSASLVQMWLDDSPPEPNLVPSEGAAKHRLRVFGPGRLDYLERRCNRAAVFAHAELQQRLKAAKGKAKKALQEELAARFPTSPVSLRPEPGLWQGYDPPSEPEAAEVKGGIFDPRLVTLALSGKRLSLPATLKITEALRNSLLSVYGDRAIPEWVCGHGAGNAPSKQPHLAFLALPFVGSEHADGRLMGVALAIPKTVPPAEVEAALSPWLRDGHGLPRTIKLFDGRWFECTAELETRPRPPVNLIGETWTGAVRRWASVTPVVLDRHFDGPEKWDQAAESVKESCERAGLPRPLEVLLHPVSLVAGVPRSSEFPWMRRKRDGGRMHHAHALLIFAEEVAGPVLIGAGRFRGYGLFRPLRQGDERDV